MTRGNQRELARAKAAKKQQDLQKQKKSSEKGANKGLTLEERHRDAEIMRLKQEKKAGGGEQGATGGK